MVSKHACNRQKLVSKPVVASQVKKKAIVTASIIKPKQRIALLLAMAFRYD